jgi:hypothetical protein
MSKHRALRPSALLVCIGLALVAAASAQEAGPLPGATPQPPPASTPAKNVPQPPPPQSAPINPANVVSPAPVPASQIPSGKIVLPSGTRIPLVLHNAISTRSARPGDPVYLETLFPVMVDGHVVIPAGSYVSGEVTETKRAGRVKGRAELGIKLTNMILPNAYQVSLNAVPGSGGGTGGGETIDREGKISGDSDKASDAGTVMKTTAAGAGIGAIAARSAAGAGIGAGIGAATGLAAVLLSRGPDAELPRGTTLEAVTDRTLYLDADKVQFTSPGQASTLPGPPNREPQRNKVPF